MVLVRIGHFEWGMITEANRWKFPWTWSSPPEKDARKERMRKSEWWRWWWSSFSSIDASLLVSSANRDEWWRERKLSWTPLEYWPLKKSLSTTNILRTCTWEHADYAVRDERWRTKFIMTRCLPPFLSMRRASRKKKSMCISWPLAIKISYGGIKMREERAKWPSCRWGLLFVAVVVVVVETESFVSFKWLHFEEDDEINGRNFHPLGRDDSFGGLSPLCCVLSPQLRDLMSDRYDQRLRLIDDGWVPLRPNMKLN